MPLDESIDDMNFENLTIEMTAMATYFSCKITVEMCCNFVGKEKKSRKELKWNSTPRTKFRGWKIGSGNKEENVKPTDGCRSL